MLFFSVEKFIAANIQTFVKTKKLQGINTHNFLI